MSGVYHLEISQYPKRVQRYNLDGAGVGAVLVPWVEDRLIELGEHKWRPGDAEIKVWEGPEIAPHETSLGRGWARVERESEDVTAALLAEARSHVVAYQRGELSGSAAEDAAPVTGGAPGDGNQLALAMQLGALLGPDAVVLLERWRAIRASEPALSPSEALARAEAEL